MNKSGPIVIIEDDPDDQDLFTDLFIELEITNPIRFFGDGDTALEYLTSTEEQAFIILSDINLPKLDGFQLREKIHNNEQLRLKCIPYLFFTTSADRTNVINAYSQSVQGFFTKPARYTELKRVVKNIIEYWKDCHAPQLLAD